MLEKGLLGKLLQGSGIDLKDLIKESEKIPGLLEILAEQSNKQTKAIKELNTNITEIGKKVDRILKKENE